jgi:hypothetical protein
MDFLKYPQFYQFNKRAFVDIFRRVIEEDIKIKLPDTVSTC